jgi:hypothetical protein
MNKKNYTSLLYGWNDNIEMDLIETGWKTVDWFHMAENRDQWPAFAVVVMNLQVP